MLCWCIPDDTGTCTGMFEFRYTIRDYQIVFSNAGVLNLFRLFDSDSLFYFKPNLSLARSDCHLGPVFQNGVRPGVILNLTKSATKPKIAFFKTA